MAVRIDRLCRSGGEFAALLQTIPEIQKSGEVHFFDSLKPPIRAALPLRVGGMETYVLRDRNYGHGAIIPSFLRGGFLRLRHRIGIDLGMPVLRHAKYSGAGSLTKAAADAVFPVNRCVHFRSSLSVVQEQSYIVLYGSDSGDSKLLHQYLCHVRAQKARQCRPQMDIFHTER